MIDVKEFIEYHMRHADRDSDEYVWTGCCVDKDDADIVKRVVEVLHWEESVPDEEGGAAIARLDDGKLYTFEEWQDYSGHGCRCGTTVEGPFEDEAQAALMGLTSGGRKVLGLDEVTGLPK